MNKNKGVFVLMAPYFTLYAVFILLPILLAGALSFSNFNGVRFPDFTGLRNYVVLLTQDPVFLRNVLPNTLRFAVLAGLGGYALSFFLAWSLAQITPRIRTVFAVLLYLPSMTGGIILTAVWSIVFAGNESGYLNGLLMSWGFLPRPIQWLQDPDYLLPIMILVSLWSSMGVGFLAMLAGILNVDKELYDAARIDGVRNRAQELIYVTIPSMRPQMLFGAVMAIVGTFQNGAIGPALTGSNPTPQYAGQLIVNHVEDYGFIRFEMGYAAAVSLALLAGIWLISRLAWKVFGDE
ncbi:MAG: sugar ABC transporter permease [Spirochaetales bacterium]